MSFSIILGLLGVHQLAVVSPGPDFVIAVKNAIRYGIRASVRTALGFGLGILVHITYSVIGIAYIISQSIIAFSVIKYCGVAYLLRLGLNALFLSQDDDSCLTVEITQPESSNQRSGYSFLKEGFISNVLNPKATLFFLSLFTVGIDPQTSFRYIALLGILMAIQTSVWFMIVGGILTRPQIQHVYLKTKGWIDRTLGAVLTTLGVLIAFGED